MLWKLQQNRHFASMRQAAGQASRQVSISFWTWQHQKPSNSARLPQFLNLTKSRTKQICETSSIFEVDNLKSETILRDFLQKWKVECRADGLVPMLFAIFRLHLSKVLRKSYEVLHLSRKIISANLKIWCSQMQPLSGNQRPDLLTALMNMSLVLRLPRKMHLCRSSSKVPRLPSFLDMLQNPHVLLTFDNVHNPLRLPCKTTPGRPKVLRTPSVFCTFDFEMCFAPQRRALFRHLNFQKWCAREVFLAFSLAHVLRATMVCNFSSIIWPDGSAPAALASLLFDPPEPQIMENTHCYATFLPFRAWIFFLLRVSLFWSSLLFSSLLWLFPSLLFICPYCRKFDF